MSFDVPFPTIPNVSVSTHRAFTHSALTEDTDLLKFMSGFVYTIESITLKNFAVRVTRRDGDSWGVLNSVLNSSFAIEYIAVGFFPPMTSSDGQIRKQPPGVNPLLKSSFHARITGDLVVNRTGVYTLFLVGGNRARLRLNGSDAISLLRRSTAYEGNWPFGSIQTYLQNRIPMPIEIQFSTAGSVGDARASLHWSFSDENVSYARSIVPYTAFQHRPRQFCLTYGHDRDVAHAEECVINSPYQLWRLDGGFIRAAGDLHSNSETTEHTRCLTSTNTDGTGLRDVYDYNKLTMRPCEPGGYINGRTGYTSRVWSCWDPVKSPGQLWRITENGKLLSKSTRNPNPDGTSRCPQAEVCAQRSLTSREYADMVVCDLESQATPHMCLQAGTHFNREEIAYVHQCSEGDPLQRWETHQLTGQSWSRSKAFDGNYYRYPNRWWDKSSIRLPGLPFSTRTTTEDYCHVGDQNNTCVRACNKICDEVGRDDSIPYNLATEDCSPYTDGWDCDTSFGVAACARICSDRADCLAFATGRLENRVQEGVCCMSHSLVHCVALSKCTHVSLMLHGRTQIFGMRLSDKKSSGLIRG